MKRDGRTSLMEFMHSIVWSASMHLFSPWMAKERSIDDIDDDENSLSFSFLAAFAAFFRFLSLGCSPHKLDPPYILGMLRTAIPSNEGPFAKSNE